MEKKLVDFGLRVTNEHIMMLNNCYLVKCIQWSAGIYFIFSLLAIQLRSEKYVISRI